MYHLHGCVLESVPTAKYFGVTRMTPNGPNISMAYQKKVNQELGFLKRNIRVYNSDLKYTTNLTHVRPQLEYASTVGSLHTDQYTNKLESLQWRAA